MPNTSHGDDKDKLPFGIDPSSGLVFTLKDLPGQSSQTEYHFKVAAGSDPLTQHQPLSRASVAIYIDGKMQYGDDSHFRPAVSEPDYSMASDWKTFVKRFQVPIIVGSISVFIGLAAMVIVVIVISCRKRSKNRKSLRPADASESRTSFWSNPEAFASPTEDVDEDNKRNSFRQTFDDDAISDDEDSDAVGFLGTPPSIQTR